MQFSDLLLFSGETVDVKDNLFLSDTRCIAQFSAPQQSALVSVNLAVNILLSTLAAVPYTYQPVHCVAHACHALGIDVKKDASVVSSQQSGIEIT